MNTIHLFTVLVKLESCCEGPAIYHLFLMNFPVILIFPEFLCSRGGFLFCPDFITFDLTPRHSSGEV